MKTKCIISISMLILAILTTSVIAQPSNEYPLNPSMGEPGYSGQHFFDQYIDWCRQASNHFVNFIAVSNGDPGQGGSPTCAQGYVRYSNATQRFEGVGSNHWGCSCYGSLAVQESIQLNIDPATQQIILTYSDGTADRLDGYSVQNGVLHGGATEISRNPMSIYVISFSMITEPAAGGPGAEYPGQSKVTEYPSSANLPDQKELDNLKTSEEMIGK